MLIWTWKGDFKSCLLVFIWEKLNIFEFKKVVLQKDIEIIELNIMKNIYDFPKQSKQINKCCLKSKILK